MDEVVLVMIFVCKLSLFSYAYEDGHKGISEKVTP